MLPDSNAVHVEYPTHTGGIALPGSASAESVSLSRVPDALDQSVGEALISTRVSDTTISTFATAHGTQTFIEIPSPNAVAEYSFELAMPDDAIATVERDGSMAIRDRAGDLLSGYESPWALDANGQAVPTSFRIDGDVLYQSVDLTATDAYPVIADPSDLWGWTACIGVVLAEVAGNAAVASKFAKLVTRFGSIQRTVEIMLRAWRASTSASKRRDAVIQAVGALAAEIIGVNAIKDACFS